MGIARLLILIAALAFCTSAVRAELALSLPSHRTAFERGETVTVRINAPESSTIHIDVDGWLGEDVTVSDGKAEYQFDSTLLRADEYLVRARTDNGEKSVLPVTIAAIHDAERIPVWRWGGGAGMDFPWWQQRGFTGAFIQSPKDPVEPDDSIVRSYGRAFDEATRLDFDLGLYFRTLDSESLTKDESNLVLLPNGTRGDKVYPLEPAVIDHAVETTRRSMQAWAEYPGLRHVMLNSEWQTPFCLNDAAIQDAQNEIGLDIREYIDENGRPVPIPAEAIVGGVIPDDEPHYRFLQWWWQRGHGTAVVNLAQGAVVDEYRPDAITWHEPYRLAPVRNAAKGLDCIATWTYGHPDIKRLCYTTYLQATARPAQQLVQQDITLFVYGRYAIALDESTADMSQDFSGGDPYFTAGPDYARQATWLVMSQRPDILCYYSAGKLSPDNPTLDTSYASPETFDAIGQTCDELVQPFGPAIRASKRVQPEVALLMSAASTWFSASPNLPGYPNEQTLPFASLLMMNHVPFDVLLDEDIAEGALDRYRVLVLPRADTLTQSMCERIKTFAEAGGAVIADALRADIPGAQRTSFDFSPLRKVDGKALAEGDAMSAEEMRAMMEGYASDLAPLLAGVARTAAAESPRVLTNALEAGVARYHFFVNDDRTYGPRFGEWKLRFELGVRQTAQVSIDVTGRPVLYDMLQRGEIAYETSGGWARFTLDIPAARGKLIASLPEAIGSVRIAGPETCAPGQPVDLTIEVLSASGNPFKSAHPLRVEVSDPRAGESEWSRYTTTRDGICVFRFVPAINEAPGNWEVTVTELVSGKKAEHRVECGK